MSNPGALLLAAGAARRFGTAKLLAPLPDGTPLVLAAATPLLEATGSLLVVVRPDDTKLQTLLSAQRFDWVVNPQPSRGLGSSIACAVAARKQADGWLLGLADMPHIRTTTIDAVRAALENGAALAAPTYEGQRGHPVGFSTEFRGELLALKGDTGARSILQRHQERLRLLPVDDPGILRDVDVPADLPTA